MTSYAAGWLVRHRLRRRWPSLLVTALVVALGLGGALVALGAAERTSGAFERYLDRADVGDVVINPALPTQEVDELLRAHPGVRTVTRDAMFAAGIDDGHPRTRAEYEAFQDPTLVRGSTDGRGTAMDRPAISKGRPIAARDEVLITEELAERSGVGVGDGLQVSFWPPSADLLAEPDDIVRPIAVEDLTVAGIATLPNEVLPDDLFPRGQIIVSPELTATYDCLRSLPPVDTPYDEVVAAVLPEDCATSYPYYSLELEGGAGAAAATLDDLSDQFEALNERVPTALVEIGSVHAVIATTTADEQARVERAIQPTTAALGVLGLGAAAVAILVAGLAVARDLRRSEVDVALWRQAGMGAGERARVLFLPSAVAVVAGLAVALAVAWVASPLGPVGTVRAVEPSPDRQLGALVLAVTGVVAILGLLGLALLALRNARRVEPGRVGTRAARGVPRLARSGNRPAVTEGLRAAFGGNRGAGLVAASGGVAVGVLLAAVVFGAALDTVLTTPSAYGWRWDVGILGGYGYGQQDVGTIRASLDGRGDIERWDGLALGALIVDGQPSTGIVGLGDHGPLRLTMASGRMPSGEGEVALGRRTAADIGAEIGDVVEVGGELLEPVEAEVTGIAVLPTIGRYQSDRAAPGVGIVLPPEMVDPAVLEDGVTFVGLDLAPGADADAVLEDLRADFGDWSMQGDFTAEYADPVRPAEIVDADSMRTVPLAVGALLAAAATIGLVAAVVISVRGRRRELGTLRALGFTGRQLRTSIRVQAAATMAVAMAIGVPLGLVVGRLAWRSFATRLGVVTDPTMPWLWIVGTVAGGLVVAVAAAATPARIAARVDVTQALRAD